MRNYIDLVNKGIRYSFYAIFFLVPLVLHPKTTELFEFNKLMLTYSLSLVILFFWVTKMILGKKIIFKRTIFDIPILLFLISQIISTIFSMDTHVSFWGYYTRFNGGLLSLITYIFLYYAFVSNLTLEETSQSMQVSPTGNGKQIHSSKSEVIAKEQNYLSSNSYKLFFVSLMSGLAVALWGFTSHFGYDLTCLVFRGTLDVSCWTDAFQPTVRLFSTLGQPNWLASYFSILIPFSLALGIFKLTIFFDREKYHISNIRHYIKEKEFKTATLFILLAIFLFIEVLWTSSQSGFLGLTCGLLVFFTLFIFYFYIKKTSRNFLYKFLVPIATIFIIIAFLFGNPLANRFSFLSLNAIIHSTQNNQAKVTTNASSQLENTIPTLEAGGSDSARIRLVVWRGAIDLFKKYPFFGTGVETFAFAYYLVKPQEHNLLSEWDYLYNKAHNEYLNYLATTGIFGLGTYLIMIGFFLYVSLKFILLKIVKKSANTFQLFILIALLSSYISILVSNFFGFSVVIINIYLFFIPAFFIAFAYHQKNTETAVVSKIPGKSSIIIIVVGVFCAYLELFLLNLWLADQEYSMGYNLNKAQEYVLSNQYLENAVKLAPSEDLFKNELSLNLATLGVLLNKENQTTASAEFIKRAINLSDKVVKNHPKNVVFYKTRIQTFFILSQVDPKYYNQALIGVEKARKLAPTDAKIAYNEGLLLGQNNQIEKAISVLNEAISLKPNYKDPRYAKAVYLISLSKTTQDISTKEKLLADAKNELEYILKNINSKDKQSEELLKSIQ